MNTDLQMAIDNVAEEVRTLYRGSYGKGIIDDSSLTTHQAFQIMINRFVNSLQTIGIPDKVIDKIVMTLGDSEKSAKKYIEVGIEDSLQSKEYEIRHHLENIVSALTKKDRELNKPHEENALSAKLDSIKITIGKGENETREVFELAGSEILSILDRNGIPYNEDLRYAVRKMCRESPEILIDTIRQQLSVADSRASSKISDKLVAELSMAERRAEEEQNKSNTFEDHSADVLPGTEPNPLEDPSDDGKGTKGDTEYIGKHQGQFRENTKEDVEYKGKHTREAIDEKNSRNSERKTRYRGVHSIEPNTERSPFD